MSSPVGGRSGQSGRSLVMNLSVIGVAAMIAAAMALAFLGAPGMRDMLLSVVVVAALVALGARMQRR